MSPTHPMMAMAPLRGMSAPRIPIRPGPMGRGDYGELWTFGAAFY